MSSTGQERNNGTDFVLLPIWLFSERLVFEQNSNLNNRKLLPLDRFPKMETKSGKIAQEKKANLDDF